MCTFSHTISKKTIPKTLKSDFEYNNRGGYQGSFETNQLLIPDWFDTSNRSTFAYFRGTFIPNFNFSKGVRQFLFDLVINFIQLKIIN